MACAAGREEEFERELNGLGAEVVALGEPEPLGRGGGLRLASSERRGSGPVLALNGDELVDIDLARLPPSTPRRGAAATIAVARGHLPRSASSSSPRTIG